MRDLTFPTLAYPTAELIGSASPSSTAQLAPGTEASAIHDWTCIAVRFRLLAGAGTEAQPAATAVPIRIVRRVGFIRAFARTSWQNRSLGVLCLQYGSSCHLQLILVPSRRASLLIRRVASSTLKLPQPANLGLMNKRPLRGSGGVPVKPSLRASTSPFSISGSAISASVGSIALSAFGIGAITWAEAAFPLAVIGIALIAKRNREKSGSGIGRRPPSSPG
ncbi:hypothetical protein [uncultured Sphingomonas sp.]|uniref:hypothetical protein n=1 Tax=uncultured Sphingomonas sp. TaxID=158754 RepID=UPI0025E359C9|nr:hypothetical protein [uncultured Sphingomonas sp.]